MNYTSKQIWVFITSIAFFATLIYVDFAFSKANYLEGKNEELETQYYSFLSFKKNISDLLIEDIIDNTKTKEILFKIKNDPKNSLIYQKELKEFVKQKEDYIKSKNFSSITILDSKENKSIFNIKTDNSSNQKYYAIYPIIYENIHICSIEISISLEQLLEELNSKSTQNYLFITKKDMVENNLNENLKLLGASLNYKLKSNKLFSEMSIDSMYTSTIYIFLPIKNINNEIEAYLVSKEKTTNINQLIQTQIFSFLTLFLVILGGIVIYRHLQKRHIENKTIFEQYKNIMDKSVIVSKTDPKGIITYVNEQFCKISGYSKDELIGKSHNIIRHPDSTIPFFKQMWKTILTKNMWNGVIKNRAKNGKDYYVQSTIAPILNEKNEIIEFIAIREDITDIIVKRNIFKYEKERINTLFNHIDEILIIKKDEKFEQISQKFFNTFPFHNLQEFNLQHNYISELFISKDGYLENIKSDKWIQNIINTTSKINKAIIKDKNGNERVFWVKVQKVPYEKSYYYLFILIDITLLENYSDNNNSENIDSNIFFKIKNELKLPDEIIISLIDKFISSTEENLEKLKNAAKNNLTDEFRIIIHNIKGSASTLRLDKISSIASQIQKNIKNEEIEENFEAIEEIQKEISTLKSYREKNDF